MKDTSRKGRTCLPPRQIDQPMYYMETLKNRMRGDHQSNSGPTWVPASDRRLLQPGENKDSNHWRVPATVFHLHRTVDPLCFSSMTRRGYGMTFGSGIRDRTIKRQLLLRGEKMLIEALRQTLELEFGSPTVGSAIRLRKTSVSTLWRSRSPPKRKKWLPTTYVLAL
jgi:hypothetical protein